MLICFVRLRLQACMKFFCCSWRFPVSFTLSHAAFALFFAFAANRATFTWGRTTACDFTMPPMTVQTSILDAVSYPPLLLTSTNSRYSWACQASNQVGASDCKNVNSTHASACKSSLFRVDLHASFTASNMLLRATQNCSRPGTASCMLKVEVIMSDAIGSEFSIKSDALVSFSSATRSYSRHVLPELWLKYESHRCGCVRRLLFSWASHDGSGEESCEAPVRPLESNEHSVCVPAWAFSKRNPTCESSESLRAAQIVSAQANTRKACQPVNWRSVPPPKNALATSFDGNCR